jgi:AcrR family transcriptional regulator
METMLSPSTPRDSLCVVAISTRPYHHGNLRAALLEGAESALARGGVQELSLREVAREIGVSHAAPRRHFAGKQALLDALAEDGFQRLERDMRAAIARASGFRERLAALARTYIRFATEHAALLELMYAGKHRPDADAVRTAAERSFAVPLALIAEGQAAGEVVPGDPERVGALAWASFHGLAAMANGGLLDGAALDRLVGDAVEQLLDGLRPR